MRATKTQTKTATKKVAIKPPGPAKGAVPRKRASNPTAVIKKSPPRATALTRRGARTAVTPRTAPSSNKSNPVRHGVADWMADDTDWTQLRADRHRPAWHLAALAFGLKPLDDLATRLQAAGRTDEKKAYDGLIRTLEINLTRVNDSNRLQYVHDVDDHGNANDSARRKINQFVDVAEFVRFADSRNIIVNERLWSIANVFADVAQLTRPATSTASATMAGNPVSKPSTPIATDSSSRSDGEGAPLSSVEVGTLARILVALAIHHYDYQPSQTLTTEHGKQVKRGTYAPIYKICEELGFNRPSEWETVKNLLLKASNKIGMDEVKMAVARHQVSSRGATGGVAIGPPKSP